ncbi:MAG: hypothetical protein LBG65_03940 [Puniceicoccales bacterium]|jgi:hypothetical protein|nr:hypothetical protein [Puniceicoccales bacterium]
MSYLYKPRFTAGVAPFILTLAIILTGAGKLPLHAQSSGNGVVVPAPSENAARRSGDAAPKIPPGSPSRDKASRDAAALEEVSVEVCRVLEAYADLVRKAGERKASDRFAGFHFLASETQRASPGVRAVLAAVLARLWGDYYRIHREGLLRNDAIAEAASADAALAKKSGGVKSAQIHSSDEEESYDKEVVLVATAGAMGVLNSENVNAWGASRVREEIRRYHAIAFADPSFLRAMPVTRFEAFFPRLQVDFHRIPKHYIRPDSLRPTLYDFLIYDAIFFLSSEEHDSPPRADAGPRAKIDPPLLAPLEEFLDWKPAPGASPGETGLSGAVALFQSLLRFRLADTAHPDALADADLFRIYWARRLVAGSEGGLSRVEKALRAHLERWKSHEIASDLAAELALFLRDVANDTVGAHHAAALGASLFPESNGARRCREIVERLEYPLLRDVATESVWNNPTPMISVRYQNIKNVHFRAIRVDWDFFRTFSDNSAKKLRNGKLDKALDDDPALEWVVAMPDSKYAEHIHSVQAPAGLEPGFYLLAACDNATFDPEKSSVLFSAVQVSSLALVTHTERGDDPGEILFGRENLFGSERENQEASALARYRRKTNLIKGFVLDGRTGFPVRDAKVVSWENPDSDNGRVEVSTDADGAFSFRFGDDKSGSDLTILATDNDSKNQITNQFGFRRSGRSGLGRGYHYQWGQRNWGDSGRRVHFLTDRAIYRPGQEVLFKAIVFHSGPEAEKHAIVADLELTVVLRDANRNIVAQTTARTNANGSLSGSLTLPKNGLNGLYYLGRNDMWNGCHTIRVEEYKRPGFDVSLSESTTLPEGKGLARISGKAIANTGVPVGGARVDYTVKCKVRWPSWCWQRDASSVSSAPLARGQVRTDASGNFFIPFPAIPNGNADGREKPWYLYVVNASVTDSSGETRTIERTVSVGNATPEARLLVDAWQTPDSPVSVKIRTASFDGKPVGKVRGELRIHSLKQPDAAVRKQAGNWDGMPWELPRKDNEAEERWGRHMETRFVHVISRAVSSEAEDLSEEETNGKTRENNGVSRNDLSDTRNWEEGGCVATFSITTDSGGEACVSAKLPAGIYRAVFFMGDPGRAVMAGRAEIAVRSPAATRATIRTPFSFIPRKTVHHPGEVFTALWASGHDTARGRVEIRRDRKLIHSFWTDPGQTQQLIALPVSEQLRGGFTVSVWQVSENRLYKESTFVEVPWDNKKLDISWERFRSKLTPGVGEVWTLKIKPAVADDTTPAPIPELAAVLYDASLDQLGVTNDWPRLAPFRKDPAKTPHLHFSNVRRRAFERLTVTGKPGDIRYLDGYEEKIWMDPFQFPGRLWGIPSPNVSFWPESYENEAIRWTAGWRRADFSAGGFGGGGSEKEAEDDASPRLDDDANTRPKPPALDAITPRSNLRETAFFFPTLPVDANGAFRIEFTAPEAVTRWKFLAFAHDNKMRSGVLCDTSIVTSKALMVQPNPPRFVREGDELEITVKVSNDGDAPLAGHVRLNFSTDRPLASADSGVGNLTPERPFSLAPHSSESIAWRVRVPDGMRGLVYKAVASAGRETDGEEGFLPVLPRRRIVTESRAFTFPSASGPSETPETLRLPPPAGVLAAGAKLESILLQATSAPAWSAILALPYLMEYEHECNEQLFGRLQANSFALHLLTLNPSAANVFKRWRETGVAPSPLPQNDGAGNLIAPATPWRRDARDEAAARRNLGEFFDAVRNNAGACQALEKLIRNQGPEGDWSWFGGNGGNPRITRYIVAGFGRLRRAGMPYSAVDTEYVLSHQTNSMLQRACESLDAWLEREFREGGGLQPDIAYHLYARSFFSETGADGSPAPFPVSEKAGAAYRHYLRLAASDYAKLPLQSAAHAAIALHRRAAFKSPAEADADARQSAAILESFRKKLRMTPPEFGAHWPQSTGDGAWPSWYDAPIETHALLMEAFNEIGPDPALHASLQLWLLRQKQTTAWPTTKSTSDALHALLLSPVATKLPTEAAANPPGAIARKTSRAGRVPKKNTPAPHHLLLPDTPPPLRFLIAGVPRPPRDAESGTGFHGELVPAAGIPPEALRDIRVTRPAGVAGPSWGNVIWRYSQDLGSILPDPGLPLKLRKSLFKKVATSRGDVLQPLTSSPGSGTFLEIGDTLVIRLEITAACDMEFIHLKDQHASGVDPGNVLSGYRTRGDVYCYESTKDAATHFFIDKLPAGTHVVEYTVRARHRGTFPSGIAEVQSMYAPEFMANSASTLLHVR